MLALIPWLGCNTKSTEKIIFLGHTYETPGKIDSRLELIDYSQYDHIWLGGDMLIETAISKRNLKYLDRYFDLDDENTLWALGNHDVRNGNHEWIMEFTERPLHYTTHHSGMTILVLNINYSNELDCQSLNNQYQMIRNVTDTIKSSSHLVVLTHRPTWGFVEENGTRTADQTNAHNPWIRYNCHDSSLYHSTIYPLLVEVQQRGIQVLHIAGDFGQKAYSYEYKTKEGIQFLGCGLNNLSEEEEDPNDQVLELSLDRKNRSLTWKFRPVNELAN